MPCSAAMRIQVSPSASSAIVMPPEAEPVRAASMLVATGLLRAPRPAAADFVEPGARALIQLARYPKLNQSDFPCGKIIYCTDHAELLVGHHLRQNRGCLFQSLHIMAYIRDNRALLKIRTGLLHFPFNTRF